MLCAGSSKPGTPRTPQIPRPPGVYPRVHVGLQLWSSPNEAMFPQRRIWGAGFRDNTPIKENQMERQVHKSSHFTVFALKVYKRYTNLAT